ncbi:DUF11 domain-containing protein [Spirosoma pollinicola]|nr:DUF11 domain-containing protein [Spirosoma pollinicola]
MKLRISNINEISRLFFLISILTGMVSQVKAQVPATNSIQLTNLINKAKANQGDVLIHTLVVSNTGTTTATDILVRDSSSVGVRYIANSAIIPGGTTFATAFPVTKWLIPTLSAGQSLSLTYQVAADSSGIMYNTATIPGDTATACVSIPVRVCKGDTYLFQLAGPVGRSSYRWFKDGIEIASQTTRLLDVTAPGSYSLAVDSVAGKCPDLSYCPFIIEEYAVPAFQASTVPASCSGVAQANGQLIVTGFSATDTYQYTEGTTFTATALISGEPKTIPPNGIIAGTLPNPATSKSYTIRVYNATGCFSDQTVTLLSTACVPPAPVTLDLQQFVNKSKAKIGELVSYTVVLTNTGTTSAAMTAVQISRLAGLHYITSSIVPPPGTTVNPSAPISTWTVASLSGGQSLSLTFQAIADSSGILYNKATIPGDTATVCTSVPVKVCVGEKYTFRLTAVPGRSAYQWFRTFQGVTTELTSFTTNVLDITQPGEYKLAVDNQAGKCPDFSCCPFIVDEDSLPTFKAKALPVSCIGNMAQSNGQLVVTNVQSTNTYQYSLGATFNESASLSGSAKVIPTDGVLAHNLVNPSEAQAYTVRVYTNSGCYSDVTVLLVPTKCSCPAEVCVPFVISQSKRVRRIGDAR